MCDCMDYEYEDSVLEDEEKKPERIAMPIRAARARKN